MAGRPSKYTPELVDKIISAITLGAPFVHACNYAGISEDTFARWRSQYADFAEAVKNAEGNAVVGWLDKIEAAAKDGNWQAAAWKLERRHPHDFGRRDRMPINERELEEQFRAEMDNLKAGREASIPPGAETDAIN